MKDPFNALTYLCTKASGRTSRALRVAVKDNIAVKGWPLTCASEFLKGLSSFLCESRLYSRL